MRQETLVRGPIWPSVAERISSSKPYRWVLGRHARLKREGVEAWLQMILGVSVFLSWYYLDTILQWIVSKHLLHY